MTLAAGTLITTTAGDIPAARLARMRQPPRIVTYNHFTSRFEPRRLLAVRMVRVQQLRELITETGRSLWLTGDHPVFAIRRGYALARTLRPGSELVTATPAPPPIEQRGFVLPWMQPTPAPAGGVTAAAPTAPRDAALPHRARDWIKTNRVVRTDRVHTAFDFHTETVHNLIANGVLTHTHSEGTNPQPARKPR